MSVVLCTLALNEMEHLLPLYQQHKDWPELAAWVFVESADRVYASTNPGMVNSSGLSVDDTSEFLEHLAAEDPRVIYIPFGFSGHPNPAQGKCESRSAYLKAADRFNPEFLFILDADEFYTRRAQSDVLDWMRRAGKPWTGFCFRHRHPWWPPALAHESRFSHEVKGGFWDIPLCRGWRWQEGLRYQTNHNTPETAEGVLLDKYLKRYDQKPRCPECVHLAFASSVITRHAKNAYYAARGEGRVDHRGWYVESRAAYENWQPGDVLPRKATVTKYNGPIPEVFR